MLASRVAPVRLSSTKRSSRSMRWWLAGGVSYRAYAFDEAVSTFCVSTRSTEAMVLLEGSVTLEIGARRQAVEVHAGQLALVPQSTPHLYSVEPRSKFVIFDLTGASPESVVVASSTPAARLTALADRLWDDDHEVPPTSVHELGRAALRDLPGARAFPVEPVQHTRMMHRVRAYLEAHHTEPLCMNEVARVFGVDPFYLSRSFKRDFGAPPQAYLQFLRTEHFVWDLLFDVARARSDLGWAARSAGFGDYATFSKRIAARFGKPPSRLLDHR